MRFLTPLPASLRFGDPAVLIATWFGAGLLPKAPGTWGSLAALPPAMALAWLGGASALVLGAGVAFALGLRAAAEYAAAAARPDPSEVVIDEVAALWLVLAILPPTPAAWLAGFLLFRFFDIAKPWPVSLAERTFKGGLGIMADDMVAAAYAILVFFIGRSIVEAF